MDEIEELLEQAKRTAKARGTTRAVVLLLGESDDSPVVLERGSPASALVELSLLEAAVMAQEVDAAERADDRLLAIGGKFATRREAGASFAGDLDALRAMVDRGELRTLATMAVRTNGNTKVSFTSTNHGGGLLEGLAAVRTLEVSLSTALTRTEKLMGGGA